MKRLIVLAATGIMLVCFSSLPAFSQGVIPKPTGKDEWGVYDHNNDLVGSFKRTEKDNFKFYSSAGEYVGLIVSSREWLPRDMRRSYTRISPEEARLYLHVLEAIDKIDVKPSPSSGRW